MPYADRQYYNRGFSSGGLLPPGVKWLLIVNTALFLLYFIAVQFDLALIEGIFQNLALIPAAVVKFLTLWQLVTYMFLHDPRGFGHIIFNMLTLWMFGKDLENAWGTRRFLKFYFICGVGAGICVVLMNYIFGTPYTRTIGASGAIYGLLLAFGMTYPDTTVLYSFLFPMKAKYFVMIIGAVAFLSSLGANNGVSNIAHLGGMLFGYLYLKSEKSRPSPVRGRAATGGSSNPFSTLRDRYKQWQVERARRKFQVYMRKNDPRGPWVN